MCLIVYRAPGAAIEITLDDLRTARTVNPDGWGIMWAKDGLLHIKKGFDESWADIWPSVPLDCPSALHFRFSTGGQVSRKNAHPFLLCTGKRQTETFALGFMHNGVLPYRVAESDATYSDTFYFSSYLKETLRLNPELIRDSLFQDMLGDYIGSGNKFLFMESTGEVHLINDHSGSWINETGPMTVAELKTDKRRDLWVSNTYSFKKDHRIPKKAVKIDDAWESGFPFAGLPYVGGDKESRSSANSNAAAWLAAEERLRGKGDFSFTELSTFGNMSREALNDLQGNDPERLEALADAYEDEFGYLPLSMYSA